MSLVLDLIKKQQQQQHKKTSKYLNMWTQAAKKKKIVFQWKIMYLLLQKKDSIDCNYIIYYNI